MVLIVISENNTHQLLFESFLEADQNLFYFSFDQYTSVIQKLSSEKKAVIFVYPFCSGEWNTDFLAKITNDLPLFPLIVFCNSPFENQALEVLDKFAWDFINIDQVNQACFQKTIRINIRRGENLLALKSTGGLLKEAKEYSNRLLMRMSHEIRTPLNAVIGMAEILGDSDLNSKQQFYVETIKQSGTMLVALFNDLLDYTKIEAGSIIIHEKPFHLLDSLRECINSTLRPAIEKRIELMTIIDPELPVYVQGDDLRIRQILLNLLDNAVKFTTHGFVKLEVRKLKNEKIPLVEFQVSDSGPGIGEELLPYLFKAYSQLPEPEGLHKKSIGLGLAICDHLVKQMSGNIEVKSILGEGSTFRVTIPLKAVQDSPLVQRPTLLKGKRALLLTNKSMIDNIVEEYCVQASMQFIKQEIDEDHPVFDQALQDCDLLITHLRPTLKIDLKLIDSIREYRIIPHILIKERERINEKMVVIRKDTVVLFKPLDLIEFWDVAETVLKNAADELNIIERQWQFDERMSEYHPLDILIAEDNAINQRIIMGTLNRYGYQVKMVENGKEAIESLERRIYDVVLMDIRMPIMDGITATKYIREHFKPSVQPFIIALTADALHQNKSEYLEYGMDEVLYKPVQAKALMQLLQKCKRIDRSKRNGKG